MTSRLIMPWKWNRWIVSVFYLLPLVAILAYFVTGYPVTTCLWRYNAPEGWRSLYHTIYDPFWWCYRNSEALEQFCEVEDQIFVCFLGPWSLPPADF